MRRLSRDYIQWVNADIARLEQGFSHLGSGPEQDAQAISAMFAAAHDAKGQGSTFGYPLVTRIAGSLCKYLKEQKNSPDVIAAHIDALKAVIAHRLAGDGGAVGERIAAGLEATTGCEPTAIRDDLP
ncbi:MAG: Hpt domain-containing protein [Alphaproteobacteria bacterium]|nr:Hpt domain-containing protein [Alphaproteobacteria bacterium]